MRRKGIDSFQRTNSPQKIAPLREGELDRETLVIQLGALKANVEGGLDRGDWLWASTPSQAIDCALFLLDFLESAPIDKSLEATHEG